MFVLLLTILISPLLSQTPAYSSVASEYFGSCSHKSNKIKQLFLSAAVGLPLQPELHPTQ